MSDTHLPPEDLTALARTLVGLPWPIAQESTAEVLTDRLGWTPLEERPRLFRTGFGPDMANTSYAYDELAAVTVYLAHFTPEQPPSEELLQRYGWAVSEYYGESIEEGEPGKRTQVWDASEGPRLTLFETRHAYTLEVVSPKVAAGRRSTWR